MTDWEYPAQGWTEERKQAWRIERLLEKEIQLLERISSQLPPAEFDLPGTTATMEFAVPGAKA